MKSLYTLLRSLAALCILLLALPTAAAEGDVIMGMGAARLSERKKWHRITLTFEGPHASETETPNPFMDYRLVVSFNKGRKTYVVPGYFAADGDAANTSASEGNKWRVHFAPDETGTWRYTVSFRKGRNVAVSTKVTAGDPVRPLHGKKGSFTVSDTDKKGRDLRGKGRLQYVGKHHLRFAGTGEYFLKQGTDSPENLLHYAEFDNPTNIGGIFNKKYLKTWAAHVRDWKEGDPSWKGGKGKGIIGAVNYLAGKGMNAMSFLTMNLGGDDRNVFPYADISAKKSPAERLRFDCSKLDQWEIVLEHATRKGMHLHFKLCETENESLLDGGKLGIERKLYYRELIARFSHHLALNWNLGEESGHNWGKHAVGRARTSAELLAEAEYFHAMDPYRHPVVLHTIGPAKAKERVYGPLLGKASKLTGASHQTLLNAKVSKKEHIKDLNTVYKHTREWVEKSARAGKPWVVACDEPGMVDGKGLLGDTDPNCNHDNARKYALWANIMAGGAGCEWYFGFARKGHNSRINDLTCQDFRSRDRWWDTCRHALMFFKDNKIPFWDMTNCASSSSAESWCLSKKGEVYVVYLWNGGSTTLDLGGSPRRIFSVHWYDPRNGGELIAAAKVKGGRKVSLGLPPNNPSKDWVMLVRKRSSDQ